MQLIMFNILLGLILYRSTGHSLHFSTVIDQLSHLQREDLQIFRASDEKTLSHAPIETVILNLVKNHIFVTTLYLTYI